VHTGDARIAGSFALSNRSRQGLRNERRERWLQGIELSTLPVVAASEAPGALAILSRLWVPDKRANPVEVRSYAAEGKMHRFWLSAAVIGVLSLASISPPVAAQDAPKKEPKVFVEVCVVEVSLSKLRSLGFHWDALLHTDPGDLLGFMDALQKDGLIRELCHPRLATMGGRPASLQVGDAIRLNMAPKVLDSQKIQLEYRVELNVPETAADGGQTGERRRSVSQLVLDSATELVPGKSCCVSETRTRRTNEQGKVEETATIVLLRADFKPPADVRTAAKPSAPQPALKGLYPDIEVPLRR
jgi:hypothetical protein